jgi:hypothetical protein
MPPDNDMVSRDGSFRISMKEVKGKASCLSTGVPGFDSSRK